MNKAYRNSETFSACEAYIFDVYKSIRKTTDTSLQAEKIVQPLEYYLRTGRCSARYLKALFTIQPWRVAKELKRFGMFAPVDEVISTYLRPMLEERANKLGL